jgi:hypothetical protein
VNWNDPSWKEAARHREHWSQSWDEEIPAPPEREGAEPFEFIMAKDIELESKEFLIDGFLGRHEITAWYGPPDAGKSTVKIDAACHVAAGLDYCGRKVVQGAVLYVAAERGRIVRRRIKAWCKEHGLPDIPLAVVDKAVDLRTRKIDADRIIATAKQMEAACGQPVVWIIFDTLNRVLAGGDENSPKDMGAVVASVDLIYRETHAHCSLIHHVPVDRIDRMRGHSSLLGAVDTTVRVSKDNGTVIVEIDIAKDLDDPKPQLAFTFRSVWLLTDPNTGIETTAPVMVPAEVQPVKQKTKQAKVKLPKSANIALAALREAIDELGTVPPASNHIPQNTKTVTVDQWRDYAERRSVSGSDKYAARRQAFRRSTEHLISAKIVAVWTEQAWIP